jgi:hypothetical protein
MRPILALALLAALLATAAGCTRGSEAISAQGSAAGSAQGSAAGSAQGSAAGSAQRSAAGSAQGSAADSTQGSAVELLIGTWTLDTDAMRASEEFQKSTPEEKQMAEMMFSQMKMDFTFTATDFRTDMEMMGQKESDTKPYTVKSANGNTLVLSAEDENGKTEEIQVVVAAKTLTFQSPQGSFTLRRKQ